MVTASVMSIARSKDVEELPEFMDSVKFLDHGRSLATVSTAVTACLSCKTSNNHCWDRKADQTGRWDRGVCCNNFDTKCREYDYCTDKVTNEQLKLFTCPVDIDRCPSGSAAELFSNEYDQRVTKAKTW